MTDLAHVLRHLPSVRDPNLLVGSNPADDAAVYRMPEGPALVQSVDFFTPVVDDPHAYGQIAVANSLSDVYAMGGEPRIALNIVGFPVKSLSLDRLGEILRGGAEKAAEAGVLIVGGHTVDDTEPKYGLAVTGTVDPERLVTAHGARPGDILFLTKPIGTGLISTALKAGSARASDVAQATRWMASLNRDAASAMLAAGATAATDITGFGLLGHLHDLAAASGVSASLRFNRIPLLPFALQYAAGGSVPGGTWTNLEQMDAFVRFAPALGEEARLVLADPQTSGGLLVALPPNRRADFIAAATPTMAVAEVGEIESGKPGHIGVTAS